MMIVAIDPTIDVAGERITLLHERAVYWQRTSTLLVADPHFGKAAAFRASGVPVPRGTTSANLRRLGATVARTGARRIVFLGDFLHAREGRSPETLGTINAWRQLHRDVDMVLVRGNHDTRAGDPPTELDIRCVDGPVTESSFVFAHHPHVSAQGYVIAGHIHPGVRLAGTGREHARLPCFLFGARGAVLPAFGEFTGLASVDVTPDDRVWVIADDTVLRVR